MRTLLAAWIPCSQCVQTAILNEYWTGLERELVEGQSWAPNASGCGTDATGGTQIAGWNLDALKRVV